MTEPRDEPQVRTFALPDVGEGLTEAEVLVWHVAVGDQVVVNQVLVEIETAKAAVELPSPFAGEVVALLVEPGATVPVGTPIITVATAGTVGVDTPAAPGAGAKREAVLVGYGVVPSSSTRRRRTTAAGDAAAADLLPPPPEDPATALRRGGFEVGAAVHARATSPEGRVARAKPPVRKRAKELGVDLQSVTPTGADGVVTRADVEGASALSGGHGARRDIDPSVREERIPVRGVLRAMADAMVRSASTAPHVTEWVTVDVTETMRLGERLRAMPEFDGATVGPTLFAAWALCRAVGRHPRINATWDEPAGEVVVKHYVNLGVAAATPRGLVVPNIKDAQNLDLVALARALKRLTETARAGRTAPADLAGGTVTLTNVGMFGVDGGTPILNPGEAAILCLGQVATRPWVVDGAVVPREVCEVTLSFDHRHVDGALGSQVLADIAATLRDPAAELVRATLPRPPHVGTPGAALS